MGKRLSGRCWQPHWRPAYSNTQLEWANSNSRNYITGQSVTSTYCEPRNATSNQKARPWMVPAWCMTNDSGIFMSWRSVSLADSKSTAYLTERARQMRMSNVSYTCKTCCVQNLCYMKQQRVRITQGVQIKSTYDNRLFEILLYGSLADGRKINAVEWRLIPSTTNNSLQQTLQNLAWIELLLTSFTFQWQELDQLKTILITQNRIYSSRETCKTRTRSWLWKIVPCITCRLWMEQCEGHPVWETCDLQIEQRTEDVTKSQDA